MKRWHKLRIVAVACYRLAAVLLCAVSALCVDSAIPSSVDVYWKSTRTIAVPGVTTVVVLDENIAHAELGNDSIEFVGIERGETVALAYVNGSPVSIVVRVMEHPVAVIQPSLLRRQAEMAHGSYGSDIQIANSPAVGSTFVALDSMSWAQHVGDNSLTASSQIENNTQFGGHMTNLRMGNVNYRTPSFELNLIDFNQTLTGEKGEDRVNNFSYPNMVGLRGGGLAVERGKNEFSVFGGSTIPYYFLSLNGTRDVGGISFHRKQTDRLSFFGGTSYLNIPFNSGTGIQRRSYVMEAAGTSYRFGKGLVLGTQAGYSNAGSMWRVDGSYSSFRLSGYGTAILSSQTFPLNQIQSLFAGTSIYKMGLLYKTTSHLTQGLYYEHNDISPGLIYRFKGSSDYLSPTLGYVIARGETLNFAYTYSRSAGGFSAGSNTGNRYDVALSSEITPTVLNNAQATIGSFQDPLQINSQDQFSLRDSVTLPIKGQTVIFGVEQDRVNPSLIAKLNQELSLLSPALQAQFLADPAAFIDSTNFPPEVKAILAAERPSGTTLMASSVIAIGDKIRLSPNLSVTHSTNLSQTDSWSQSFGYSFTYLFRPTLQFRSGLSNVLLFQSPQNNLTRTTMFTFGFQKMFVVAPIGTSFLHHSRVIEGRVFRDNNINGAYNVGEPGLQGVEVRLEDGQVAITDEQGRYKFNSVSPDMHEVSLALTQFRNPIRMTTRSQADVDLIQQHVGIVNFGILDFARLMGTVYNDLRFDDSRQADSKGMQAIELLLDNGKEVRKIQTTGSGDFELDEVPPGDYKLSLDPTSIPPNYITPVDSVNVHVTPVSTVVQDIPVRALRSISGTVLLKSAVPDSEPGDGKKRRGRKAGNQLAGAAPTQEFKLVPLSGVQIAAGVATATTDADGKFLLRNLPAGELKVTVTPVKPVPAGMNIPSGVVKLPAEPIEIQGATVVITNSELLPYLVREFHNGPANGAGESVAAANRPKAEAKPVVRGVPTATKSAPQDAGSPASSTAVFPAPAASVQPEQTQRTSVLPATTPNSSAIQPPTSAASSSAAPPLPQLVPRTEVTGPAPASSSDAVLTREMCHHLPSLGEIAQCLRQLKLNSSSPTPK